MTQEKRRIEIVAAWQILLGRHPDFAATR